MHDDLNTNQPPDYWDYVGSGIDSLHVGVKFLFAVLLAPLALLGYLARKLDD